VDDRLRSLRARLRTDSRRLRDGRAVAGWRRRFAKFYQCLPDKHDIFYMFFSGGLLHWVATSAGFVPDDVNLVLIGSGLPAREQEWVRESLGRPFFHVDLTISDDIAWTFLYDINEHNFGWLDIDCFVFNGALFGEMTNISSDVFVNATWWLDSGYGFPLASSFFQFVNVNALRILRANGLGVSPDSYSYRPLKRKYPNMPYYPEVLTRRLRKQLLKVMPADAGWPGGIPFLDTTYMAQLVARTLGLGGGQVRRLVSTEEGMPPDEYSSELIHIGAVRDFSVLEQPPSPCAGMLRDFAVLNAALNRFPRLPPPYTERYEFVIDALAALGLTPEQTLDEIRRRLTEDLGVSAQAAEMVVTGARGLAPGP
jgi:hypothetical protein